MDHVDNILKKWAKERSDLNFSSMKTVGRIKRISLFFDREIEKTFTEFGLHAASFDVLATLLRSGPPYTLSPSELIAASMVTSGTMTNRLDQLEKAGLIIRTQSETDKRSFLVSLSEKGYERINKAIDQHVKTQDRLTEMLSPEEKDNLSDILRKITLFFEDSKESDVDSKKNVKVLKKIAGNN